MRVYILILSFFCVTFSSQASEKFHEVFRLKLSNNQPIRATQIHSFYQKLKNYRPTLSVGFINDKLSVYRIVYTLPQKKSIQLLKKFKSSKSDSYIKVIDRASPLYCRSTRWFLACSNSITPLSALGEIARAKKPFTIFTPTSVQYFYRRDRSRWDAGNLFQAMTMLQKYLPTIYGRWQKIGANYRLSFSYPNNYFSKKYSPRQIYKSKAKVALIKNRSYFISWRESKNNFIRYLSSLGIELGTNVWLQQESILVRTSTQSGSLLSYKMNDIEKEKKKRKPKAGNPFFKIHKQNGFLIYGVSWLPTKGFYALFHQDWYYLATKPSIIKSLVQNKEMVAVPKDYFYYSLKPKVDYTFRDDEVSLIRLFQKFSELRIQADIIKGKIILNLIK